MLRAEPTKTSKSDRIRRVIDRSASDSDSTLRHTRATARKHPPNPPLVRNTG
jgi:hypothetical protein